MLSLLQRIRAGIVLYGLCKRHTFVRAYVSLVLKFAPVRYRRLFKIMPLLEWAT